MYCSLSLVFSIFLSCCAVFSAAASADCFTPQGDSYTTPTNLTQRTSVGIVCSKAANKTCTVHSEGSMTVQSTLNVTPDPDDVDSLFEAVGKAFNAETPKSITGTIPNGTYTVAPGKAGHVGFTLTLRCYDGTVGGGDCFKNVAAGASVTACVPSTLGGNMDVPNLDGTAGFVQTDEATAAAETDVPNLVVKDADSAAVGGAVWSRTMMMMTIVMMGMAMGGCWLIS